MLDIEQLNSPHQHLRVAVVSETWPPEINGVAVTMHRLAVELERRGHSIQVIRPRQALDSAGVDPLFEETLTRGLPIPAYPHLRMGLPAKQSLMRLWQRQRPDVVHIATEGPLGWSAMQAARQLKLPVSSDFRTNFHQYGQHYGLGKLTKVIAKYLRKFHNLTHFTTVPTEKLRLELQALGFERLAVLSRGVDTERFSPEHRSEALRQSWGVTHKTRVYLYVGRLAVEKNPVLLAKAWRVIATKDAHARLVIVGDGPASVQYRELMPDAIYVGSRRGEDLATHYASADVFLFPSTTETYGNVVPEAMASGLMGLTYDYAASSELVRHDHNGWVAAYGDDAHYLALASELAVMSPVHLARCRKQAHASMQSHGWDAISMHIEHLWREQMEGYPNAVGVKQPRVSEMRLT